MRTCCVDTPGRLKAEIDFKFGQQQGESRPLHRYGRFAKQNSQAQGATATWAEILALQESFDFFGFGDRRQLLVLPLVRVEVLLSGHVEEFQDHLRQE